ncbi:hypothetical protein D3C87_32130 [compost metagenome]
MQKNIKNSKSFCGMKTVSESRGLFGRKVGRSLNRFEKGEQLSIHHHAIQQ